MTDSQFLGTYSKDGISRQAFSREEAYRFQFDGWELTDAPQTPLVPERPAKNASLEAWQNYAEPNGVDIEGKSRDQLAAIFHTD
jgi:hypothetical protein